jgi:general stress protein 26
MDFESILSRASALLGEGRPALLSTLGPDGYPRSRWMTPAMLPRLRGRIYAVTSMTFPKASQIESEPRVEWTLTAGDFSEVLSLRGSARVLADPSFSAEVLKAVGPHLPIFWGLNTDPSSVVVVETEVEYASLLVTARGLRHTAYPPAAEGDSHG